MNILQRQSYNTYLNDIGNLAVTDSNFIVSNGTTWVAESGNTARTSLGLGTGDSPTFTGLNLSGLTASRLIATDASKNLSSVAALTSWIAGTTNQVTVTDDGDGTVTLSTPQNIHSGATPTFAGLTINGASGNTLVVDTNTLVVDATSGRVGIGTTGPQADLHVAADTGGVLRLERTNASYLAKWDFIPSLYSPGGDLVVRDQINSRNPFLINSSGDVGLGGDITTDTFTGATMVAKAAGGVGINQPSPGAQLHVVSSAAGTHIAVFEAAPTPSENLIEVNSNGATGGDIFVINKSNNTGIGTTTFDGTAAGVLAIGNGTAPAAGTANQAYIYAKDVSASSEMHVMDEAGNETQISPHDPETGEWVFYSKNTRTGKVLRVQMERLVKFLNNEFGTDFVQEFVEAV